MIGSQNTTEDKKPGISFFSRYKKNYWKPFLAAILILSAEAFCDLLQPTIMSRIIDVGVANKNIDYVISQGGLMLLVTLFGAGAAITRNIISSNVSQKFGCELRSDLYKKIQGMSFESIDKMEPASLITRLTNDITQVQHFFHGMMRIFVKAPILSIGSFVMAYMLNPRMTIVFGVVVPVIAGLIILSVRIGYPYFAKVQKGIDSVNSVTREYLSGIRVVKAFGRHMFEKERFERVNKHLTKLTTTTMRIMTVFSPSMSLVINFGIIAVLWLGGLWVNYGDMNVGKVIAFTNYMTQLLHSLMMISFVFNMFVRAKASSTRIKEVFSVEDTIIEPEDSMVPKEGFKGEITFEDVTFSYIKDRGEPVLENISFELSPGETLGIIGSTGSGKTTLVNLIPRFYDVDSGFVKIDGIDVKNINLKVLRDLIAVVPQKTILFTGTIFENLLWGRDNASNEEVVDVAKTARAHEFIMAAPEGYDTMLGQGGVNLSGGQKQRISIARALIRNPRILILDDCTSAVDVTTEAHIRKGIRERTANKQMCVLIIAQRITSVMRADKILVLENGREVGFGTHDKLIKDCPIYRDIYRSQLGEEGLVNE